MLFTRTPALRKERFCGKVKSGSRNVTVNDFGPSLSLLFPCNHTLLDCFHSSGLEHDLSVSFIETFQNKAFFSFLLDQYRFFITPKFQQASLYLAERLFTLRCVLIYSLLVFI